MPTYPPPERPSTRLLAQSRPVFLLALTHDAFLTGFPTTSQKSLSKHKVTDHDLLYNPQKLTYTYEIKSNS